MTTRTVAVVHREPLVAEAIASALGRYPWLVPIATASRAEDPVLARVDAVVLDASLDGAARIAHELRARGRHVILLGRSGPSGAPAVSPERPLDELAHALAPGLEVAADIAGRLTGRERQILGLVARGLAGKQVARLLGISPKTVEQHKTRIYRKLDVPNQAAAVAVAATGQEEVAWISSST